MNNSERIASALAYLPIIGWLYVIFGFRQNREVRFHFRQAIGLYLYLAAAFAAWAIVAWLLAWIPLAVILSVALFTLVIVAYLAGFAALIMGVNNALRGKLAYLPIFGRMANNLPF